MVNIMIADDNIEFAHLLANMLTKEEDFRVVNISNNGFEAIISYTELKPDVLLLDLAMPGYDGLEVLRVLSEKKENDTNIIVMSGDMKYRAAITYASKIKYIFQKPFDNKVIIEKIREFKKSPYTDEDVNKEIYNLLQDLNFNMYSKGTLLLIDAIKTAHKTPSYAFKTEELMKSVAKSNNTNKFISIRSTIDKSINAMYEKQSNLDLICKVFPEFYGYKPTVKSLITNTINYLNNKFQEK
ncbi:MAG: response regulator [Clostridia bacterium]|nr:response regulator [Clostridia bacterium]